MPKIGGLNYTYADLTRMSGLSSACLFERYRKNPKITLGELISPPKTRVTKYVIVRGREMPLYVWAKTNKADVRAVFNRWNNGIRDPYSLIRDLKGKAVDPAKLSLPTITDDMIEWLNVTEFARKGQPDEWEIACELIGISAEYAKALREFMEGRSDRKG